MSESDVSITPDVTVLMPVYNAEKYLREAIESVLSQTYKDFELLIINDGCNDDSMKVIAGFKDKRIKVITNQKNEGLIASLNTGLKNISTKYIARADADDISLPKRLTEQVKFMDGHPEVGACGTWFNSLRSDGEITCGSRFSTEFDQIRLTHLYQIQIIHGTSMLRNRVLKQHNLNFDPNFKHAEDYDFFDRLGNVSQLANLPKVLYLIRHHEDRVSSKFSQVQKDNSDIVKKRVFKSLGVEVDKEDLIIFQHLMHQDYSWFNLGNASKLALLLKRMVLANNKTGYYSKSYLRKELVVRFLHLSNFMARSNTGILKLIKQFGLARATDAPKLFFAIWVHSTLNKVSRFE